MEVILHIAHGDEWEAAKQKGSYRPASLDVEGFIHCSTPKQTVETANAFFKGVRGLVLLCIDAQRLSAELRFEDPAGVGGVHDDRDERFPHIYGELNTDAVFAVEDFPAGEDGRFSLPPRAAGV